MSNKLNVTNKQRQSIADKLLKKPPGKLEPCDLSVLSSIPTGMTRAYRNNRFTVMIFDNTLTTHGIATRALIQNHHNIPITNHWKIIQEIKNEIFGREITAVEYFPKESELMDTHYIYWIFIYPEGILPTLIK